MTAVFSENNYLRTLIPAVTLHGTREIRSTDVTASFSEYNYLPALIPAVISRDVDIHLNNITFAIQSG